MILRPRTLYCLKLQIRMASLLKVIPYEYSKSTGLIRVFPSLRKRILWKLNILAELSYAVFIYGRFYQLLKFNDFESINKTHFAIHLAWVTGISIIVAEHAAICFGTDEIQDFINSYFTFLDKMDAKYQHNGTTDSDRKLGIAEILLQLFPFTPWVSVWTNFFIVFFLPACPALVTSVIEPSYRDWWPILIPCSLMDYYLVLCVWKQALFFGGNLMAFLKMSSILFSNMQVTSEDPFMNMEAEFKQYRAMQVLSNKFNACFGPVLTTYGSCTIFITEVTYGLATIKLFNVISGSAFPIFPMVKSALAMYAFSALRVGASYYEGSKDLIRTWKNLNGFEGSQAFLRSCQPLKLYLGRITYVVRESALAYMALVIQNTINGLLAMEFE